MILNDGKNDCRTEGSRALRIFHVKEWLSGQGASGRRAFTLVELLIVVAIIALLAAIAVPNFLEAQTRAKVSRMEAELRTAATALETYAVDNRRYPKYGNGFDKRLPTSAMTFIPISLTTPIAYLTTVPNDVFSNARAGTSDVGVNVFTPARYYHDYQELYVFPDRLGLMLPKGHVREHHKTMFGFEGGVVWQIFSRGPDRIENHGTTFYDPTNGTLSRGDIMKFGP